MNTTSALVIRTDVQSKAKTNRLSSPLNLFARILLKSRTERSIQSDKASSRTAPGYRLGEAVHHVRFGTGRVMSHWPDGRLLVRFDGAVKSRLVFPTLLNREKGRWG